MHCSPIAAVPILCPCPEFLLGKLLGCTQSRFCCFYSFLMLCTSFALLPPQRVLQKYAHALLGRLPRTANGAAVSSVTFPCTGTDWHVRMPKAEEQVRHAPACGVQFNAIVRSAL